MTDLHFQKITWLALAIEAFKTDKVDKEKWFAVVGPEARATRANSEVGVKGEARRTMVVEVQPRSETKCLLHTSSRNMEWLAGECQKL